jgi:hypothetical protein
MAQPQKKAAPPVLAHPQIERYFFNAAAKWTASLLAVTPLGMNHTTEPLCHLW